MAQKSKKKNTKRNIPQKKIIKKKFRFNFKKKVRSEEERKKLKKTRIIVSIVLAVAIVFASLPVIANVLVRNVHTKQFELFEPVFAESQLTPARDTGGSWTFITNRNFKIMQLSDVEIAGGFLSTMEDSLAFNAIETMVSMEKPDLLIITGDIVNANILKSGSANNLDALRVFAELIDKLEVYWTVTLGDADSKGFASKQKIAEYLASEEFEYCLFEFGDEAVDGFGNNIIKIKNIEGEMVQAIYTFDTHGKSEESITASQIEWYKTSLADIEKENSKFDKNDEKITKSLAFMHKPLEEYKVAFEEYSSKNTENIKYHYGEAGESVNCFEKPDNLFETMLELKSTQGIFCGHDHLNTFSMDYKGIRLTYGGSIDYFDYKDIDRYGKQRNCTIIEIDIENGSFDCWSENFYQDRYISYFEKGEVIDIK